jgi:hypothetical protein
MILGSDINIYKRIMHGAFLSITSLSLLHHSQTNRDNHDVSDEEIAKMKTLIRSFYENEGFYRENEEPVYFGYLSRGGPLNFARTLTQELTRYRAQLAAKKKREF